MPSASSECSATCQRQCERPEQSTVATTIGDCCMARHTVVSLVCAVLCVFPLTAIAPDQPVTLSETLSRLETRLARIQQHLAALEARVLRLLPVCPETPGA